MSGRWRRRRRRSPPIRQTDVNVIFIQLESYIDPSMIQGLELSEDPVPNWTALKEAYSSGYLTVPVVGAGTANTEFEVLTGMSSRFFGPGEYPFQTCLKDQTVESVAYDLKENGLRDPCHPQSPGGLLQPERGLSQSGL